MKYTIDQNQKNYKQVPEVGEFWTHDVGEHGEVFMRIDDEAGVKALGDSRTDIRSKFYSVNIASGYIANTLRNSDNIYILVPKTPIVLVLKN